MVKVDRTVVDTHGSGRDKHGRVSSGRGSGGQGGNSVENDQVLGVLNGGMQCSSAAKNQEVVVGALLFYLQVFTLMI